MDSRQLLEKSPVITETQQGTLTRRYVRACDARNWDGTESGLWPADDTRIAMEKELKRNDGTIRVWNFWFQPRPEQARDCV